MQFASCQKEKYDCGVDDHFTEIPIHIELESVKKPGSDDPGTGQPGQDDKKHAENGKPDNKRPQLFVTKIDHNNTVLIYSDLVCGLYWK